MKGVLVIKVIDFEKKGNLLRLYLGEDDCYDYWGDDWNDTPYEHNAGAVYDRYVSMTVDIVEDFDGSVCEPSDDWHYHMNSPYCKEDFKNENAPCVLIVPPGVMNEYWSAEYSRMLGNKRILAVYYNQPYDDDFKKALADHGCKIIKEVYVPVTVENE